MITKYHLPELLLFNKFSGKKITYLGYETGQKPTGAKIASLSSPLRKQYPGTSDGGIRDLGFRDEHYRPRNDTTRTLVLLAKLRFMSSLD
jgi:hypothetical protein